MLSSTLVKYWSTYRDSVGPSQMDAFLPRMGAIEPTNAGVEGRPKDAQRGWLQFLEPGESRTLRCTITATNDPAELQRLLDLNA